MSFDCLHAEILAEFAAAQSGYRERLDGYLDRNPERLAELRKDKAWRRQLPALKARAVEVTREWRQKQLATPETAAAYRAKRAAQSARWRKANPEKTRLMKLGIERRKRERLRQDATKHAAFKARKAERRRESRAAK